MAGGGDFAVSVSCARILELASPSLQNCVKFSNNGKYFSVLCDFGIVCVCELKDNLTVVLVKRLVFGKGELLEGHSWSSDDQVFAVAGWKIYLFHASKEFSSLHTIPLYYMPKDISLILRESSLHMKFYSLAVAGPNGVELYQMEIGDNFNMGESSSLHSDLAIALVQYSPDKQYLAVAALDGHFGIWTIASLDTDQKEFWYVHLKTVRITSIEFSPDSAMVAVAGWEGTWHCYKKTVQDKRFTWMEFYHGESNDRVSGDLPGSFISWSPDNRFIRVTQYKENKVCLSTFDTQTFNTTYTPLDGIVKGISSFGGSSGDYSLCFMRSKLCVALPWPARQVGSSKPPAAFNQQRKLLFQESFEGSVSVELSPEGGVTLLWKRASQEGLAVLRAISNKGLNITEDYQPSDKQRCTPVRESALEYQQDKKSTKVASDQDVLSKLKVCDDIKTKAATCRGHGETSRKCIDAAEHDGKSKEPIAEADEGEDQILAKKDSKTSEGTSLKQTELKLSEKSLQSFVVRSRASAPKCTPEENKRLSRSETDERICEVAESYQCSQVFPEKACHAKTKEESEACITNQTFCVSDDVCCVQAPFLNPRLFQSSSANSSPLLAGSSVQLLVSTNYMVVVILPLLAYVYCHTDQGWTSLLFPSAVKSCCITKGKYLVLLTIDGRIRIWCLESMTLLYSSHRVVCDTDIASCLMCGNSYEPLFNIVKLDKTGRGEILRISIQPNHGDFRVSVNRLPACYPDIISQRCSGRLCGSVGQLIVFKHNYYEERDQTKPNHGQDSCTLQKWTVIVPELHILQMFIEAREYSSEVFVFRHQNALKKLDSLLVVNSN